MMGSPMVFLFFIPLIAIYGVYMAVNWVCSMFGFDLMAWLEQPETQEGMYNALTQLKEWVDEISPEIQELIASISDALPK